MSLKKRILTSSALSILIIVITAFFAFNDFGILSKLCYFLHFYSYAIAFSEGVGFLFYAYHVVLFLVISIVLFGFTYLK